MVRKKAFHQSGNIFFYVLLGIVLLGLLVAALRREDGLTDNIDSEAASLKANQMLNYAREVATAVRILQDNGVSESDIRFSHPLANAVYGDITTDPPNQVFSDKGGNAKYRLPPAGAITAGATSVWEFTAARRLPQVGSDKVELIASLANVDSKVCLAINKRLGMSTIPSTTCGSSSAFVGTYEDASPIIMTASDFPVLPAPQVCVYCSDRSFNFYMGTLLAR